MDARMVTQDLVDRTLHIGVQMDRINDIDIIELLNNVANCPTHVPERITEALPPMRCHKDHTPSTQVWKTVDGRFPRLGQSEMHRVDSGITRNNDVLLRNRLFDQLRLR